VMSVLLMLGWLTPLAMVYGHNLMGMPRSYFPILYFTGPMAMGLTYAAMLVRSKLLWYVSGVFLGVVLLGQWMPLTERGYFFARAQQIHPGMTIEEVRGRLQGIKEEETIPAPYPTQQEFVYGWDLDGDSSMDVLVVNLKDGRVQSLFLGSEN